MTQESAELIREVMRSNLTNEYKNHIVGLIWRDNPGKIRPYFFIDQMEEQHRGPKCGACGRHIYKLNRKWTKEKNRFCPQCGQRLDWESYTRENSQGEG